MLKFKYINKLMEDKLVWYEVYLEQIRRISDNNVYIDFKTRHKKKAINITKNYKYAILV